MYVYETGSHISVSSFLNQVHTSMCNRFKFMQTQDTPAANELQAFFQQLKATTRSGIYQNGILSKTQMNLLLEHLQTTRPGAKLYNLFYRTGRTGGETGAAFERDLTNVIQAVYEAYDFDKGKKKEINIGTQVSSVANIIDEDIREALEDIGVSSKKLIEDSSIPSLSRWVLPKVTGKIDVQGLNYTLNIDLSTSSPLERILVLLNEATISAKSYRSTSRDGLLKLDELYPNLHLGKSNPYRAFAGALAYAGFSTNTINSAFYAGYHAYTNGDKEIGKYFYQLRFMYELMGVGILNAPPVKYFIYNDPTGEGIYVDSTANLVYQVLTDESAIPENPFAGINIKKRYMRERLAK